MKVFRVLLLAAAAGLAATSAPAQEVVHRQAGVEKLNLEESIVEQQVGLRALVGSLLPETTDSGPAWR